MIKIENVPLNLFPKESRCAFSDDSRFIYFFNNKYGRSILVYDSMYNSCITLTADKSVIEVYEKTENLREEFLNPILHTVDETTLIMYFKEHHFKRSYDNAVLLIMIKLNFEEQSFSFLDKIMFKDCENSKLTRDGKNLSRYVLMHSFAEYLNEFDDTYFWACYFFELRNNNKFHQSKKERLILDYKDDEEFFCTIPGSIYLNDNELWISHEIYARFREPINIQISYFNINEPSPKEIPIRRLTNDCAIHWVDNFLVYVKAPFEYFQILNLDDRTWAEVKNSIEHLKNPVDRPSDLFYFVGLNCNHHIDRYLQVTAIHKPTQCLLRFTLKGNPEKLIDIAWMTALNSGILEREKHKLPNKLHYKKWF